MSIIKLNATEHLLTLGSNTLITEGSRNVDGVKVEFDSSWNGYAKLVVFSIKNQLEYTVLDENEFGKIPNEILTSNSEINICAIGIKDSGQLTTNIIKFRIKDSLELELEEPDETVYRQILSQYAKMIEHITDMNHKYEVYQEDVQRTKNTIKDLNMEFIASIESIHASVTGTCEVYRMGNLLLVNYEIGDVGTSYVPSVIFQFPENIPICKKSALQTHGTISVMSVEGTRNISVINPATSGVDKSCSGELILMIEPEDGEFHFNTKIVETLPVGEQIDTNCIYFIPKEISEEISKDYKKYNKYVYIDGAWELINEDDEAILVDAYKGSSGYIYFYRLLNRMIIEFRDFTCTSKIDISLPNKAKAIRKYSSKISNTNIVISGNSLSIEISTEAINGTLEVVLGNKLQGVYVINSESKIFATNTGSTVDFEAIAMGGNEIYSYNHKVINIDTGGTFESGIVNNGVYKWEAVSNATRKHYCEITDSAGNKLNTNKIISVTTDLPAVIYSDENILNNIYARIGETVNLGIVPVNKNIKYYYRFTIVNTDGNELTLKDYSESNTYKGTWTTSGEKILKGYIKDVAGNITQLNSISVTVE